MPERRRRNPEDDVQVLVDTVVSMTETPQGRLALVVLVIVGVLAYGAWFLYQRHLHPYTPVGPTVRLATWNLHEFSPRPQIDLRRIAEIIQSNQFDLLCIQEVRGAGEEVDALLNTLGPPWRGARYSPTTGNHERFAFLYNGDHVQELGPAEQAPSPEASIFARTPYEDSFRAGNFTFTVLTVHLEWTNKRLRAEEAQALARMLPDLEARAADHHLIVAGDFNEEHQHGNLQFIEAMGWQRLIHDPTNLSSTEDFDNFLIDPRETPQFSGRSGVVPFDQLYRYSRHEAVEAVSDHRPAYADFATQ